MMCGKTSIGRTARWMLLASAASCLVAVDRSEEAAADENAVRVLVVYHTLTGQTQKMAEAAAEGAQEVTGTEVTIKKTQDVTREDLAGAEGLILACPTYYANIPGSFKESIDQWSWKWKVDFTDKVGGAVATGGGQTGGKEHVVISLLLFMINNRMVVAGPLYQDAEGEDIWAELGATAATGPTDPGISDAEREAARRVGQRVAELAKKIKY